MKARFKIQKNSDGWVVFDTLLKRVPMAYSSPMIKGMAEGLAKKLNADGWHQDVEKKRM